MFKEHLPQMKFYQTIANHLDILNLQQALFPEDRKVGLTAVCLQHLGKEIDKSERMSNWEKRPLREAQKHYGALDAYCLVSLVNKLIPMAQQAKIDLKTMIKPEILSKEQSEEGKGRQKKAK
jgi:ribonuclease D